MPATITFSVPGAPKGKGRPRTRLINGHVSTYTPPSTRAEESSIRLFAAHPSDERKGSAG